MATTTPTGGTPHGDSSLQDVLHSYRRLFGYVQPYKTRFFFAIFTSMVAGASTAILYVGLKAVTAIVLRGETGLKKTLPLLGEVSLDDWIARISGGSAESHSTTYIVVACLIIPVLMTFRGTFDFLTTYHFTWIQNHMTLDLRKNAFSKILAQSLGYFNRERGGDLIQTVGGLASTSAEAAMTLTQNLIRRPVALLSVVVALFMTDPVFMGLSLVVFPICMLPVILLSKRVRRFAKKQQAENFNMMGVMHEAFNGIRIVKSHAREAFEIERFDRSARAITSHSMKITRALEVVGPLVETTASFGIAGGLFYCWWRGISFDEFMARCVALIALYPEAKALSRTHLTLQNCVTSTEKLFQLMDRRPDIEDAPNAVVLGRARGELRFEGVTYRYRPEIAPAVEGVNLHFLPGKFYALVGESGAGKTTLMALLLRFYDPQGGRILLDGHDLRKIAQTSLREQIGIVNQDLFLFHDTIENNIRYGRPQATREEVEQAARIAHAHEFILKQPQGYDTVVGDKGCNLSGGQQQRLTIARAIVRNAPLLFLDEATSNLDPETEQAFRDALRVLRQGRTVVAIAHRFSTILEADQIVVMDKGRVADAGSHAELMGRCPIYQRLYQLQFEGKDEGKDTVTETA